MGSIRIKAMALALTGVAAAIGLSAQAGAGEKIRQVKTEVRFLEVDRSDFKTLTGSIAARFPCLGDRDVTLWYKPSEAAPQQKLGTDDTNRKGKFVIELDSLAIAGLYGVSVTKLLEVEDGDRFLCKPVRPVYKSF